MDIETATIDELYAEIKKRSEGCVLILRKLLKHPIEGKDTAVFVMHWKNFTMSLGLIEEAKLHLHKSHLEHFQDINPSEVGLEE